MDPTELTPLTDFGASINGRVIALLRRGAAISEILEYACEALTRDLGATRCVVWLVVGDWLQCTQEFCRDEASRCFLGNSLPAQESMALVLEFFSIYPDEAGSGIVAGTPLIDLNAGGGTMDTLCRAAEVQATLSGQLRSRGEFSGFIQLQQSGESRTWTDAECEELLDVSQLLSAIVKLDFDQKKLAGDAWDLKLLYDLTRMFGPFDDHSRPEKWASASTLIADRFGFGGACVYLDSNPKDGNADNVSSVDNRVLNLAGRSESDVGLVLPDEIACADVKNPILDCFRSQKLKVILPQPDEAGLHSAFAANEALLLPLKIGAGCLGVLALWKRLPGRGLPTPQMREFAIIVCQHLAEFAAQSHF
ncbi:MAG: GAF domain-containing protein [Cyanobacteria bacterium REEB67]|nr:GAF domain-containing protein [Cyanobacteria bacterium REEB67]